MKPEEFAAKLRAHPLKDELEPVMQKIALIALRNSQAVTPVRTGTLRRSETTRVEASGLRGYVGTNVEYAPFVHLRRPFFAEGIENSQPQIEGLLEAMGKGYWSKVS